MGSRARSPDRKVTQTTRTSRLVMTGSDKFRNSNSIGFSDEENSEEIQKALIIRKPRPKSRSPVKKIKKKNVLRLSRSKSAVGRRNDEDDFIEPIYPPIHPSPLLLPEYPIRHGIGSPYLAEQKLDRLLNNHK